MKTGRTAFSGFGFDDMMIEAERLAEERRKEFENMSKEEQEKYLKEQKEIEEEAERIVKQLLGY